MWVSHGFTSDAIESDVYAIAKLSLRSFQKGISRTEMMHSSRGAQQCMQPLPRGSMKLRHGGKG